VPPDRREAAARRRRAPARWARSDVPVKTTSTDPDRKSIASAGSLARAARRTSHCDLDTHARERAIEALARAPVRVGARDLEASSLRHYEYFVALGACPTARSSH